MTVPPASPPVAFRLKRPYHSEDEFVAGDGHSVFRSGMVLIGAGPRPPGLIVRFELALRDGTALFRGEGKVVAHRAAADGERPAGLEIKFTRLDARGKALVHRVLDSRAGAGSGPSAEIPEIGPLSMPPPSMGSMYPSLPPAAIPDLGPLPPELSPAALRHRPPSLEAPRPVERSPAPPEALAPGPGPGAPGYLGADDPTPPEPPVAPLEPADLTEQAPPVMAAIDAPDPAPASTESAPTPAPREAPGERDEPRLARLRGRAQAALAEGAPWRGEAAGGAPRDALLARLRARRN